MDGWGRQGDFTYKKAESWQQSVPSWEKRFCQLVGSVSWGKLLETKKCMHLYSNIVNWNDSAGEEAFQNAKKRFYANLVGIPCDIPLPDPNIYINEVDWNSKIHPDVIRDLESGSVSPDVDNKNVIIFGSALISNEGYSSAGWGDDEEEVKKATNTNVENNTLQWDSNQGKNNGAAERNNYTWCQTKNNHQKVDSDLNNGWGEYGWRSDWNHFPSGGYVTDNVHDQGHGVLNNGRREGYVMNNVHDEGWGVVNNGRREGYAMDNVRDEGWGVMNNGRREGSGRYNMSRYRTSRFHGHDNNRNHYSWRNGRKGMNMNTSTGQVGNDWR